MFSRRLLWGTTTAVSLALTGVLLLPSGGSLAAPGEAGGHLSNRCDEKHPDRGRDGEVGHHNPKCATTTITDTSTTEVSADPATVNTSTATVTIDTPAEATTTAISTGGAPGLSPVVPNDVSARGKSKATIIGNIGVSIP